MVWDLGQEDLLIPKVWKGLEYLPAQTETVTNAYASIVYESVGL